MTTTRKPPKRAAPPRPTNPRELELIAHVREVEIQAFCLAQTTAKTKMREDVTREFWGAIEKWRKAKYGAAK